MHLRSRRALVLARGGGRDPPVAPARGPRRRRDRRRGRHRLFLRAHARRSGASRPPARGAGDRGWRERAERRVRAARRCAGVRPRAVAARARRVPASSGRQPSATWRGWRRLPATRSGRSEAFGWRQIRPSVTTCGASMTRSARTASTSSGGTSCHPRSTGCSTARSSIRRTARSSLPAGSGAWPPRPRRRAPRSASTTV